MGAAPPPLLLASRPEDRGVGEKALDGTNPVTVSQRPSAPQWGPLTPGLPRMAAAVFPVPDSKWPSAETNGCCSVNSNLDLGFV